MQPTLTLAEGVELGHAVVERAARDSGVRILVTKGRVAEHHALREPRQPIDVDVLVEPAGFERLVRRLQEAGWSHRPNMTLPLVTPYHSLPMRHEVWPCELDLHLRFPGFLAAPDAVFEALWDERSTIRQATREIPATGPLGTSLVVALHCLRNGNQKQAELDALIEALTGRDLTGLAELAGATGSLGSAAPLLEALEVPTGGVEHAPIDDASARDWGIRGLGEVRALHWFEELRRTGPLGWVGVILRALLSNERELREDYPDAPPGRRGLWVARWRRLRRGLPHVPRALLLAVRRTPPRR